MAAQVGTSVFIQAQSSQISGALLSHESVYHPIGWKACTPTYRDDNVNQQPIDGIVPQFGGQARFALSKNSTLVEGATLVVDIAAAVLDAGRNAAWVKNFGDQFMREVTVRYGSTVLQFYPGEYQYMWARMTTHDNHIEGRNAQVLGGLTPGAAGGEAQRIAALTAGMRLYCPLDELYFTWHRDEAWMPEAYALELELQIRIQDLGLLVYSDNGADPFIGAGTTPAITAIQLRINETTLSAAEKEERLQVYNTANGHVVKMLDIEQLRNFRITGTGGVGNITVRVPLDNFRMDIAEMFFVVREEDPAGVGVSTNWVGDALESDATPSLVTGASVATMVQIVSFRLEANGKVILPEQEELWNRVHVRQRYHPDTQIADPIYTVVFAIFPEDRKNATGHQNAAHLGHMELVITLADFAVASPRRVDVFAHSHNLMQSRGGSVAKALQ